jgi:hypothetical protein
MSPTLLHCPRGARKNLFAKVAAHFEASCETPERSTVTLITYNNGNNPFPIERQASRLNMDLHVTAREYHPWSWTAKVVEPLKVLHEFCQADSIVLLADGNDTIFTLPPYIGNAIRALEFYERAEILFCPTPANWPPSAECAEFERGLTDSVKPHLSAGAYIGKARAIFECLSWIDSGRLSGRFRFRGRFDDQLAWRQAHRTFTSRIRVDSNCIFFDRFDDLFIRDPERSRPPWSELLR